MRSVRIWYEKLGKLQYISHLDMNRLMSKVVRRAGIPIWYTEGFNPHPYVNFLLPLPLFTQSKCEIMDIKITDDTTNGELKDKFNAFLPDGMRVTKVADPWGKPTEIAFSQYDIVIDPDGDHEDCFMKVSECLMGEELIIIKKQKQGKRKIDKEVNLIEEIHSFYVSMTQDNRVNIDIILPSGTVKTVNPRLLTDALLKSTGVEVRGVSIMRKRVMNANLEDFE
ncbi:MAG: TIGR03936 family radical SAM-associated protein [Clostridia bacterium]|nr:TIGR03936 family radical SAM-associated protein [Clostridia bacterium]